MVCMVSSIYQVYKLIVRTRLTLCIWYGLYMCTLGVVHLVSCPACIHLPVKNGLVNKVELLGIILVCIATCFIDTVNYAFMI